MKKKRAFIVIVVIIFSFYLGTIYNKNQTQIKSITHHGDSMIAMYIQDEDGNYNLSDAQKFPTDGYVLNTEKSSCKNGGKIAQNASTKALSLKVKTSDECTVYFDIVTSANPSADMLIAKANDASVTTYTSGNKKEMFEFDHPEATQTTGWSEEERKDYRYIGNEPNNYITFNDETWRIIGVFTVENESGEKEQLMKIIRDQSIGILNWNSSDVNEWSTASLQKLLNGDYYNQTGSYTSTASVKGLSTTARSQIAKVKWYLGSTSAYSGLGGPDYYNFERGTTVYSSHTTSIIQNVGLMYPSDYVYTYAKGVNDICYTNGYNCNHGISSAGWLFNGADQWTLSPFADSRSHAFHIYANVSIDFVNGINGLPVRPVVFLDSKIAITGGDGSESNPYTLSQD